MSVTLLLLLPVFLPLIHCWPNVYDNEFKRWSLSRRSFECQSSGGKCYSTGDCCKDYVCAAFDDFASLKPTMPGWCVHEKELEPCVSSLDCDEGTKCKFLGSHRYCVPDDAPPRKPSSNGGGNYPVVKGTIGSDCTDDKDCAAYDSDGRTRLCCQKVRRGRLRVTQKCDPITPITVCINTRR